MGTLNRAQRRTAKQSAPKKKCVARNLSKQEIIERIQRNGITTDDLQKNYDYGFKEGYMLAGEDTVKSCYAAICLVLKEKYGFGFKRCKDVLTALDDAICNRLTGDDLIQQVFDELKITINFKEPFDRVQEAVTT